MSYTMYIKKMAFPLFPYIAAREQIPCINSKNK